MAEQWERRRKRANARQHAMKPRRLATDRPAELQ